MTSTISLSKVKAVLKKNFRLNIAGLIVTNVTAVLCMLVICAAIIGVPSKDLAISSYVSDVTVEFSVSAGLIANVIGVIYLLFLSLKMFREIYSRRASDFFYSMPVTRKEYYTGNVFFGIINILFMFISITAVSLIFGKLPIAFDVEHNIIEIKLFLQYMAIAFSGLFLTVAVFMVSAVLCGRRWQAIAASVLSGVSLSAVMMGVGMQMNSIYGYNVQNNGSAVDTFLAVLNKGEGVSLAVIVIFKFVAAAVLLAVGYLVFKNRKAEVAEQSLSGKIVPSLLLFVIDVGVFMTAFSAFYKPIYFKIIIGVVCCVIVTVIFCAVFNKKAFTKNTDIACVAACVVSIAFAVGVETLPKAVGYIDYIPSAEEIQSVEFTENADNYAYVDSSSYTTFFDYLFEGGINYDEYEEDAFKIETQEGIDCVLRLHQKAIDDEIIKKYEAYNDPDENTYIEDTWFSYKLTYHLKNGKDVTRYYSVSCKDMMEEYADFVRTDEVIEQSFPFNLNKDSILFARVEEPYEDTEVYDDSFEYTDDYSVSYSADSYFTLDNYDEFFGLLKQDIKVRSDTDALLQTTSYFYLLYDKYIENEQYIYIYYLDEDTPAELAEKIRNMTPSQAETYMYNSNYDLHLLSEPVILSKTNDKNTMKYLTDRGIIK